MRLIDLDKLRMDMYIIACETINDDVRWDGCLWIKYGLFEDVLSKQPIIQKDTKTNDCGYCMGATFGDCDKCNK